MRAARIHTTSEPPRLDEIDEPRRAEGEALVETSAAGLNPIDRAVASGLHYAGQPPLPYTLGAEGVGRLRESDTLPTGTRVYIFGHGVGIARDGTLAELVAVPEQSLYALPEVASDELAAACGIPGLAGWVPVTRRADVSADDTVLVLGATGTVGRVALQAARLRGARRIVAAGRDQQALERARELGADTTVRIDDDFERSLREAFDGDGPTVVIDPVWGEPAATAVRVASTGARIVNIGQSAGPEASLRSADVRGRELHVMGYTDFALSREELTASFVELIEHAAAGRVHVDFTAFPLNDVAAAWEAQGRGEKAVVQP